jgi:hypothetical protein
MAAEITAQLREMKAQIDKDLQMDLKTMSDMITRTLALKITATVTADVLATLRQEMATMVTSAAEKAATSAVQKAAPARGELVTLSATQDMVLDMGNKVQNVVYNRVIAAINTEIMPKVNNLAQWANYQFQDCDELVDNYRRGVEAQSREEGNIARITDGRKDKTIISPHVRTLWDDDDSDDAV